jgi:hypothetical protein
MKGARAYLFEHMSPPGMADHSRQESNLNTPSFMGAGVTTKPRVVQSRNLAWVDWDSLKKGTAGFAETTSGNIETSDG